MNMSVTPVSQPISGAHVFDRGQTHTVQRGETLSQIARQHGVSLSALIAANPQIANPDLIYPDQAIDIPSGDGGTAAPAAETVAATATASTYAGGPLTRVQLAQLFHQAGFRGENLVDMVAIAMRESGGDPRAFNGNVGTGDNSYGLTQINMLGSLGPARLQQFGLSSAEQLFDPLTNAQAAYMLSGNGTDLSPWGGYKGMSNTYNTDLDAARAAVAQAEAEGLLGQPFQSGGTTPPATDAAPAATPASSAASMPTLRIGARGEAVADLQRRLQAAGFGPGPVDGWFGPQTQAAVRAFQHSRGITVDGWVGPQTWGQLLATGAPPSDGRLAQGASGPEVRELQQSLQALGYYHGHIGGNFGPLTDAAVRNFQRDHGLAVDGWAGPQTMAALREAVQGGGTPPVTPPPVNGAPGADVQAALDFGLGQLGAPYVGGGSPYRFGTPGDGGMHQMDGQLKYRSPAGVVGFDCSGLVVAMYRQAGVDLAARGIANTRTMQASLAGVAKDQLQPGDLLVKGGSHVVIYLGDTNGDGRAEVLEATSDGDGNGDGIGSGDVRISDAAAFLGNPAYVGRRVPPGWYA